MSTIYYKHFKGNYYKLLSEGKDSETQEEIVIYQALFDDGQIWVRPKSMFFENVSRDGYSGPRFSPVNAKDVHSKVDIVFSPRYHFPELNFTNGIPALSDKGALSPSVQRMITIMKNKGEIPQNWEKPSSDDELERIIIEAISSYPGKKSLRDIFNYIQMWGGTSGRGIYVNKRGFHWEQIEPEYTKLVSCCLATTENTPKQRDILINAVKEFNKNVPNIGLSFITKHTRYWLTRTLKNDALPIFDSVMASNIMVASSSQTIRHLKEYWDVMTAKARQKGIQLIPLERQLFKHFYVNI